MKTIPTITEIQESKWITALYLDGKPINTRTAMLMALDGKAQCSESLLETFKRWAAEKLPPTPAEELAEEMQKWSSSHYRRWESIWHGHEMQREAENMPPLKYGATKREIAAGIARDEDSRW